MSISGHSENSRNPEVVVVTGASAGLGRAIVREFARHNARIGLIARDHDRLQRTVREVAQLGGEAIPLPADVADAEQVRGAADEMESHYGPIDIWINNAMTTVFAPFLEVTPEEYKRATEVTYLGAVWGTMAALRKMQPRNRGAIVQIGSALAYRSIPLQAPYCGAKHAIKGFTDTLRTELIHDRSDVHITMVHMPALNTPQFEWCRTRLPRRPQPVPPIYNPEVAAQAVYWAAHCRRREVYLGISTVAAILGTKVAPALLDRYLGFTGYDAQQTAEPIDSHHPDNLIEPVAGEYAAHGRFDDRSSNNSFQFWLDKHRTVSVTASLAILSLTYLFLKQWRIH
ncbi:MAG: SDR family oxidoreductase [Deltaproteobacteria bacterium]|nr:SDR family oxidoreductase [Deltaproteobacteria bacterium]